MCFPRLQSAAIPSTRNSAFSPNYADLLPSSLRFSFALGISLIRAFVPEGLQLLVIISSTTLIAKYHCGFDLALFLHGLQTHTYSLVYYVLTLKTKK